MNAFFWTCGHIGWGLFAVLVFTGLWWFLSDVVWRLKSSPVRRLAVMMSGGWIIGIGLILLGFHFAG